MTTFKKCFLDPPSLVLRYQQNPINPYQQIIHQLRIQSNTHEQYLRKISKQKRLSETDKHHNTNESAKKKQNNIEQRIDWRAWDKITSQRKNDEKKLDLNFEGIEELILLTMNDRVRYYEMTYSD